MKRREITAENLGVELGEAAEFIVLRNLPPGPFGASRYVYQITFAVSRDRGDYEPEYIVEVLQVGLKDYSK